MPHSMNAIEMLRAEHRELQKMFAALEGAKNADQEKLCRQMIEALDEHTRIEEEVFYPYLRTATGQEELFEEAGVEHHAAKELVKEVRSGPDGIHRHAVVHVLAEYVGHHIREEEEKIFPLAQKTGVDMDALGQELMDHKEGRSKRDVMNQGSAASSRGKDDARSGGAAKAGMASAPSEDVLKAGTHSAKEDQRFLEQNEEGLSRSTERAQWIHDASEREDHAGKTLATRNIEVIRAWAEERKAVPATTPGGDAERPRVLRFDFPDYDKGLQHVSWDAWARVFEDRKLVFLFQQHKSDGKQSNFFRLDSPEREDA